MQDDLLIGAQFQIQVKLEDGAKGKSDTKGFIRRNLCIKKEGKSLGSKSAEAIKKHSSPTFTEQKIGGRKGCGNYQEKKECKFVRKKRNWK